MTRISPKLLTGLFVLGCGPGAMASPQRGQWTDSPEYTRTTSTQQTTTRSAPDQTAAGQPERMGPGMQGHGMMGPGMQHGMGPGMQGQSGAACQPQAQGDDQAQAQTQAQAPSQNQDQDQDQDVAESQVWQAGQSHLGVVVMGLTTELRQFFGVPADRGVLVAKVEPSSAASRAGIQVGDVLVRVGPRMVRSGDDVIQALAAHAGGRIRISVIRQGRMQRLFASLPGNQASPEQDQL